MKKSLIPWFKLRLKIQEFWHTYREKIVLLLLGITLFLAGRLIMWLQFLQMRIPYEVGSDISVVVPTLELITVSETHIHFAASHQNQRLLYDETMFFPDSKGNIMVPLILNPASL